MHIIFRITLVHIITIYSSIHLLQIFREQWAGLGLACDVALITGDKDMASAMWRNLLGARGAKGIAYPPLSVTPEGTSESPPVTNSVLDASSQPSKSSEDPSSGGVTDFEGFSAFRLYLAHFFHAALLYRSRN